MKCTVCNHPQRHDIDLALLATGNTLESLSRQYGPSKSSLFRHRKDLVAKLRQSREDLENSQQQVSLLKLNGFLDHVQRGVEAAADAGDIDRTFKGSYIGSRIIHQINQMDVPLELDTVYRLIASPGFVSQDSILPSSPQIITDLHQALVDHAFLPCPDPPPEIVAADDKEDKNDNDALGAAAAIDIYKWMLDTCTPAGNCGCRYFCQLFSRNSKPGTRNSASASRGSPPAPTTFPRPGPVRRRRLRWPKKIRKISATQARHYRDKQLLTTKISWKFNKMTVMKKIVRNIPVLGGKATRLPPFRQATLLPRCGGSSSPGLTR